MQRNTTVNKSNIHMPSKSTGSNHQA